MMPDRRIGDSGRVQEIDPPRRLVLFWRNEFKPELRTEGWALAAFFHAGQVRLSISRYAERL